MTTETGHGGADLGQATTAAVATSRAEFERLDQLVNRDLRAVLSAGLPAAPHGGDDSARARLLAGEREIVTGVRGELHDLFTRQREAVDTFNLVLFGRTGTGKSSLVTALTGGEGESISHGPSDFTRDVASVVWNNCRLFDSPGTCGPGLSTVSQEDPPRDHEAIREDLEDKAHRAVQTADIVLLCFDGQNQQQAEFEQAAQWIKQYGKPVVAVFNERNAAWRFPALITTRSARRKISGDTAAQVGRVTEQLEWIGLPDTPVIAVHMQRAVFSRSSDDYHGPNRKARCDQREDHGPGKLLKWSNLPVLERLLVTAISQDAVALRLGMLANQATGALERADGELRSLGEQARLLAEPAENSVEGLLRLLGRPVPHERGPGERDYVGLKPALEALERARGGKFPGPDAGTLEKFARSKSGAVFAARREEALERARFAVSEAMARRRRLDRESFGTRVFDEQGDRRAAEEVLAAVDGYAKEAITTLHGDLTAEIETVRAEATAVDGKAGRVSRWSGRIGGVASSFAAAAAPAVAFSFAVTPVGLVVLIVSGLSGALGFGKFSRFLRRKGEQLRKQEEALAHRDAARRVRQYFDDLDGKIQQRVFTLLETQLIASVHGLIVTATDLRAVEARAAEGRAHIQEAREALGPMTQNPSGLLRRAVRLREQDHSTPGTSPWLGDDWIDDSEGLRETTETPAGIVGPAATDPAERSERSAPAVRIDSVRERVRDLIVTRLHKPRRNAGRQWLRGLHRELDGDPDAAEVLGELDSLAQDGRVRIVVFGDYNAGKSSFIRRLFSETGGPVPDISVAAVPETTRMTEYAWGDVLLIDTPGLRGGNPEHDRRAETAARDANAVVYVFAPTRSDEKERLRSLLNGDSDRLIPGKLNRTLFVINRSDLAGCPPVVRDRSDPVGDPSDDLNGFEEQMERKKDEVIDLIESVTGSQVGRDRIVVVASAPYGLPPDEVAGISGHERWDGFETAVRSMVGLVRDVAPAAADVTLLHGGLSRLDALVQRQLPLVAERAARVRELDALAKEARRQEEAGRDLEKAHTQSLAETLYGGVESILSDALKSTAPAVREAAEARLSNWHSDDEIMRRIEQWAAEWGRAEDDWWSGAVSSLVSRTAKNSYRTAFKGADTPDLSLLTRRAGREQEELVKTALHSARTAFGLAESALGPALGAVAVVREFVLEIRDLVRQQEDERKLQEIRERLRTDCGDLADRIANGADGRPGAMTETVRAFEDLRRIHDRLGERLKTADRNHGEAERRVRLYREQAREAHRLL